MSEKTRTEKQVGDYLKAAKVGLEQAIDEYQSKSKKEIKLEDTTNLVIANALISIAIELREMRKVWATKHL